MASQRWTFAISHNRQEHQENTAERNNTLLEASHLFHISIFLAFVKLVKLCEHICKYVKTLHLTHSSRAETIQISNAYHTSATLRTMTLKRTQFRGAAAECESRQGPYSSMFNLCADWASVWFFWKVMYDFTRVGRHDLIWAWLQWYPMIMILVNTP